jgi:hypothetical protein
MKRFPHKNCASVSKLEIPKVLFDQTRFKFKMGGAHFYFYLRNFKVLNIGDPKI